VTNLKPILMSSKQNYNRPNPTKHFEANGPRFLR